MNRTVYKRVIDISLGEILSPLYSMLESSVSGFSSYP